MKKRLSGKDYTIEIVLLVIGVFLASRLSVIFKEDQAIDDILLPVLGVLLVGLSVFLIRTRLIIEFDNNYLYLTRGKNSIVLPLSNVTTIEATTSGSKLRREFILKYLDADAEVFSIHFNPKENGNLEEFVELVKKQNPKVNYQLYSKFFWQS